MSSTEEKANAQSQEVTLNQTSGEIQSIQSAEIEWKKLYEVVLIPR